MKTVIVFGGSGYIGSTVSDLLLNKGYMIFNFDIAEPKKVFLKDLNYKWIKYDLKGPFLSDIKDKYVLDFVGNSKIDAIHFAAYKDIEDSYRNPIKYYNNNIRSLIVALDYSFSIGVKTFLFSSSAAVYQDSTTGLVKEDDVTGFTDSPYGYTKLAGERIVKDVCKELGMKGVSLRYFNPIGKTSVSVDDSNSLFGNIRGCIKYNKELIIYGDDYQSNDGTPIRDYIDLRDLAEAHLFALLNSKSDYDVFNVGTGKGVTVKEVAETVKSLVPEFKYKIGKRRFGDSVGGYADVTKIKEFGFNCQYTLSDSIKTLL